jgi:hypothetical protein
MNLPVIGIFSAAALFLIRYKKDDSAVSRSLYLDLTTLSTKGTAIVTKGTRMAFGGSTFVNTVGVKAACIRAAWQGRVSGCMPGKPVELLSFQEGIAGLELYLRQAQAYPLQNYVPLLEENGIDLRTADVARAWRSYPSDRQP